MRLERRPGRRRRRRRRPHPAGGRAWSTTGSATGSGPGRCSSVDDRALADPTGAGDDDDQGSCPLEALEQGARRWLRARRPAPAGARDAASRPCVRRALTLPTPGSDSSTARTLISATTLSSSARAKTSARVSEPVLSSSFELGPRPAGLARPSPARPVAARQSAAAVWASRSSDVPTEATAGGSAIGGRGLAGIVRPGDGAADDQQVGAGVERLPGRADAGLVVAGRPPGRMPGTTLIRRGAQRRGRLAGRPRRTRCRRSRPRPPPGPGWARCAAGRRRRW